MCIISYSVSVCSNQPFHSWPATVWLKKNKTKQKTKKRWKDRRHAAWEASEGCHGQPDYQHGCPRHLPGLQLPSSWLSLQMKPLPVGSFQGSPELLSCTADPSPLDRDVLSHFTWARGYSTFRPELCAKRTTFSPLLSDRWTLINTDKHYHFIPVTLMLTAPADSLNCSYYWQANHICYLAPCTAEFISEPF